MKDYKNIKEAVLKALHRSVSESGFLKDLSTNSDIQQAEEGKYFVSLRYATMKPMKNPFFNKRSTDFVHFKKKYIQKKTIMDDLSNGSIS